MIVSTDHQKSTVLFGQQDTSKFISDQEKQARIERIK